MTDQLDLWEPPEPVGPAPGEERYFRMMEINEASAWAHAGGIAIHRNFNVDGLTIGGRRRSGAAFHVLGQQDVLLEWGRRNGQRPHWIEAEQRTLPPHFDVFGGPARRLLAMAPKDAER